MWMSMCLWSKMQGPLGVCPRSFGRCVVRFVETSHWFLWLSKFALRSAVSKEPFLSSLLACAVICFIDLGCSHCVRWDLKVALVFISMVAMGVEHLSVFQTFVFWFFLKNLSLVLYPIFKSPWFCTLFLSCFLDVQGFLERKCLLVLCIFLILTLCQIHDYWRSFPVL